MPFIAFRYPELPLPSLLRMKTGKRQKASQQSDQFFSSPLFHLQTINDQGIGNARISIPFPRDDRVHHPFPTSRVMGSIAISEDSIFYLYNSHISHTRRQQHRAAAAPQNKTHHIVTTTPPPPSSSSSSIVVGSEIEV